jgi:NADH-quinone oxidoreductase subunit F
MDAARSALRSGASSVTIAYRRGREDMPAQEEEIEAAEREGIAIRPGLAVAEVVGRDGAVVALRCTEQRPTGRVEKGRAVWAPVADSAVELPAATILVAVGEEPDPSILPEGAGIEVSGWAGIVADSRTLATGRAGIFAGGDVVSGPKTIIDAVASGRRAAASVHEFLAGVKNGEAEILRTVRYATPPEPALELDIAPRPRAHPPLPMFTPGSFRAAQQGFDEAAARFEASRCFRCDAVYGCGTVSVRAGRGPADRPGLAPVPAPPPGMPEATTQPVQGGDAG